MPKKKPRHVSLRGLASELGVNHSSLSAAVRDGRLTHGVHLKSGRVVITDADAAAANWRNVHVPQTREIIAAQSANVVAKNAEHADYQARSAIAVLIALHVIGREDRVAAIAELRIRFDYEAEAYLEDASRDALGYFDQAVTDACEWLDEQNDEQNDE